MAEIAIAYLLLESLESIGKTSFHDVEINRHANDSTNVADSRSASRGDALGRFWKTIESSPGRVDIARFVEASDEKLQRCRGLVRIDGESSQFRSLRILPLTKRLISLSDSGRVPSIARIEFLRSLKNRPASAPIHRGGGKPTRNIVAPKHYWVAIPA